MGKIINLQIEQQALLIKLNTCNCHIEKDEIMRNILELSDSIFELFNDRHIEGKEFLRNIYKPNLSQLERQLQDAISREDYENCARLRDSIELIKKRPNVS